MLDEKRKKSEGRTEEERKVLQLLKPRKHETQERLYACLFCFALEHCKNPGTQLCLDWEKKHNFAEKILSNFVLAVRWIKGSRERSVLYKAATARQGPSGSAISAWDVLRQQDPVASVPILIDSVSGGIVCVTFS